MPPPGRGHCTCTAGTPVVTRRIRAHRTIRAALCDPGLPDRASRRGHWGQHGDTGTPTCPVTMHSPSAGSPAQRPSGLTVTPLPAHGWGSAPTLLHPVLTPWLLLSPQASRTWVRSSTTCLQHTHTHMREHTPRPPPASTTPAAQAQPRREGECSRQRGPRTPEAQIMARSPHCP